MVEVYYGRKEEGKKFWEFFILRFCRRRGIEGMKKFRKILERLLIMPWGPEPKKSLRPPVCFLVFFQATKNPAKHQRGF